MAVNRYCIQNGAMMDLLARTNSHNRFLTRVSETRRDSNLFITSIVPLNITGNQDEEIWVVNSQPSFTRCYKALRLQFLKATPGMIRAETLCGNEIKNVNPITARQFHQSETCSTFHNVS